MREASPELGKMETERPDPEVREKADRRTFTAEYKIRILSEVERCREAGAIGALLRREGLYSSHLTKWRQQRDADGVKGLSRRRGRKSQPVSAEAKEMARLERENARLRDQLKKAEMIISVQKKLSQILGLDQEQSA